jgi:hypothetical protein
MPCLGHHTELRPVGGNSEPGFFMPTGEFSMARANSDTYSKEGAERLSRTIMRKWRERGETVHAWVEEIQVPAFKEPLFLVKSDLVDGLPSKSPLAVAA